MAGRYGLQAGSPITLTVGGYQRPAFVAGLLDPADSLSRRALDGMLLADIATAQELTGRLGELDRIDVILPEDDPAALQRLEALLPEQASIVPVAARTGTIEQMTAAFRTNLTALSLLALVVGLFLIYNTMTFSVVQRRPLFGTLRCLGVTRNEVFVLVLAEAFVVGLLGATLGVILGVILGQGAVRAVTQTINDLYFVVTVRGLSIPPSSLAKGMVLGVIATVLAAAPPAWEAASVPPRVALSRSGLESKAGARGQGGRAGQPRTHGHRADPAGAPYQRAGRRLCRHLRHHHRHRHADAAGHQAGHGCRDPHQQPAGRRARAHGPAQRRQLAQPHGHRHRRADGRRLGHDRRQPDGRQLPLHGHRLAGANRPGRHLHLAAQRHRHQQLGHRRPGCRADHPRLAGRGPGGHPALGHGRFPRRPGADRGRRQSEHRRRAAVSVGHRHAGRGVAGHAARAR